MDSKEEKICSFTQNGTRLQLLKLTKERELILGGGKITAPLVEPEIKYQVRLNRKIIYTAISEYQMRKVFATYCQNIVLQLKIY